MPSLARLTPTRRSGPAATELSRERRRCGRRERPPGPVIASQHAFALEERQVLRELERRRTRRRDEDLVAVLREPATEA